MKVTVKPVGVVVAVAALAVPLYVAARLPRVTVAAALETTKLPLALP